MDFLQLDVVQRNLVRDSIVGEWRRRQGNRYLFRPGGWHTCSAQSCRMVQLACDVCLLGGDNKVEIVAKGSGHVRVRNLFVCWHTGKVHTCTETCCRSATGACRLTGHRCQTVAPPQECAHTVLARRALASVHRRGAVAGSDVVRRVTRKTLEYLCFSDTRRRYANRLLAGARGKTRRWVLRQVREKHSLYYGDVVQFYGNAVFQARSCTRPLCMPPRVRDSLLAAAAECVHRMHVALGADVVAALNSTPVFCLGALYLMRTGLRCSRSGDMAVPRVAVLGVILPNAHLLSSSTFPDIRETQSRSRQLTNSIRFLVTAILKVGTTSRFRCIWSEDGGMAKFRW